MEKGVRISQVNVNDFINIRFWICVSQNAVSSTTVTKCKLVNKILMFQKAELFTCSKYWEQYFEITTYKILRYCFDCMWHYLSLSIQRYTKYLFHPFILLVNAKIWIQYLINGSRRSFKNDHKLVQDHCKSLTKLKIQSGLFLTLYILCSVRCLKLHIFKF